MSTDSTLRGCRSNGETASDRAPVFATLYRCHDHILEKLQILDALGSELVAGKELEESHMATLCDVLTFMDTAIPMHSADEEETLFPALRQLPMFAGVQGTPMDCMESDHVEHGRMRARLKQRIVQRDAVEVGREARRIAAEYRSHIQKENEILFPLAEQLITDEAQLSDMDAKMQKRRRDAGLSGC